MKPFWDLIQDNLGPDFAADPEIQAMVRSLSSAFTEGREGLPADYLNDPEIQAAYLAYFVPVNFEKVYMLLSSHAGTWAPELAVDAKQSWVDFGCGPGTATLAALAAFKNRYRKLERLPAIHVDLIDTQTGALNLADILVKKFAAALKLEVTTSLRIALPDGTKPESYDLTLAANVLNELPPEDGPGAREQLLRLWDATRGVMLVLEPGHRVSSQRLIRFRERLLKADRAHVKFLGPCPHSDRCPVYRSKHWCHFSEPVTEGRLTDLNLRIFRDPRGWLKFSYLLMRRGEPVEFQPGRFRAIGDLHPSGKGRLAIDLCQPGEKGVVFVPVNIPPELRSTLVRGAMVEVEDHRVKSARPLTKREVRELPPKHEVRDPRPRTGKPLPRAKSKPRR